MYFIIPRYYTWNRSKFYVPIGKNEFPIWLSVSFRDEIISAFTYLSLFSMYYIWIDEILIIFVFRRKGLLHYNKKKIIWESVTKAIISCIVFVFHFRLHQHNYLYHTKKTPIQYIHLNVGTFLFEELLGFHMVIVHPVKILPHIEIFLSLSWLRSQIPTLQLQLAHIAQKVVCIKKNKFFWL